MFEHESNFNPSNHSPEEDKNGYNLQPRDRESIFSSETASETPYKQRESTPADPVAAGQEAGWHTDGGYGVQNQQEAVYHPNPIEPTCLYPTEFSQTKQKKTKNRKLAGFAIITAAAVIMSGTVGFAGAYLGNQLAGQNANHSTKPVVYQSVRQTGTGSGNGETLSVSEIVKQTADSVVEIRTESVTSGKFMQQYVSEGAGSGVIITQDGYIVTNNHVIDGASKITVRLKDGTGYDAALIGKDAKTDLAVIKINASGLTSAVYGDSSKLEVGETAVAIGNPLGELGGTVTSGIISALDRNITIDGETMTLLQTNAEINPGNSGGGLFNAYGELIGIVNAKSSGSDVEGLGFAIPINTAKTVVEELIENGYVSGRISLGITVVDIADPETAMAYRVSKTGVYVSQSSDNSQFQAGDRIISFNGVIIDDAEALTAAIEQCKVGDTVEVIVERRNGQQSFQLVLQEEKPTDTGANQFQSR